MSEVHLFIIWENAQYKKEEILKDIRNSFKILKIYNMKWSEEYFSDNLSRFYGTNLPSGSGKEEHCGRGPFTLIVVLDENPKYEERNTSKGIKNVNVNMFDKKEQYRKLTGGGHRIHATNTEIETNHDLTLLLKYNVKDYIEKNKDNFNEDLEEYIETDLIGAKEWESVEQIFYALNNCIKYAVLRNYECLPEELYISEHNDIDILCEDYINCAYILNAKKVFDEPNRVHFTSNVGELKLFFDLRYIGDNYYCEKLEKDLLENRKYNEKGFFIIDKENYFYSLLYHALLHKSEFKQDYIERLIDMNYGLTKENCSIEKALMILKSWIDKNEYMISTPIDQSVAFNEKNVRKILMEEKLSQFKKNIITWYPIEKEASILNIGEDEKIIEELKNKSSKVVCAGIHENLNEKFDYITVIGDFSGEFDKKLEFAKKHIKQNGKILIAINNKFGLKNWNTSCNLEKGISENLLREKFRKLEINNCKFYYILPDYKFANLIYSEGHNLTEEDITRNFDVYDDEEIVNLNENEIYNNLLKEDKSLLNKFVNSFFIELSFEKIDTDIKYVSYTNYRKPEYRVMTILGEKKVYKKAADNEAILHIKSMENNFKKLNEIGLKMIEKFNGDCLESDFISSIRFDVELNNCKTLNEFLKKFEPFKKILYTNSISYENIEKQNLREIIRNYDEDKIAKLKFLKDGFVDLIPKNCFLIDGELNIFDQEWVESYIPVEYIIYRALRNTGNCGDKFGLDNLLKEFNIESYVDLFEELEATLREKMIDNEIYSLFIKRNFNVQDLKNTIDYCNRRIDLLKKEIDLKENHVENLDLILSSVKNEVSDLSNQNASLSNQNASLITQINDYNNRLNIIASSLSWRITKPLRYASWILNFKSGVNLIDRIYPPGSNMRIKYEKRKKEKEYKRKIKSYHKFTDKDTVEYWKEIEKREKNIKKTGIETPRYEEWLRINNPTEIEFEEQRQTNFNIQPKISIIVPLYNTPTSFFRELLFNLYRQTYTNWELCLADGSKDRLIEIEKMCKDKRIKYKFLNGNKGIAGNTNEALKMATGDYISLLDHDDLLPLNALYEVVKCINENPDVDFIYSDEDKFVEIDEPRYDPHFKPDYAPDTLRANNYICHYSVFKKELMDKIGGFNTGYDGAQDYDIILRATENAKKIIHIPKILYHWRVHQNSTARAGEAKPYAFESGIHAVKSHLERLGLKGKVSHGATLGTYKIDYEIIGNPKVSIMIPNKDGIDILKVCIDSILEKTTYKNYEIIVIENNSENKETFEYYKELEKNKKIKVIYYTEKGFNYSRIINFGVGQTSGEYIVQLNNDTELITPDWIEKMLGYAQREDVGAVGVKLYYPDNTIQHAGIVVGVLTVAAHVFKGISKDVHGYFAKESLIQNMNAVTAACIMTKKEIYEQVGFMNEKFAVAFNDIDFCLKIRKLGKFVVYNPFVEFIHFESKTRGIDSVSERFQNEIRLFLDTWKEVLDKGDEYYNKNFTLNSDQYEIRTEKF